MTPIDPYLSIATAGHYFFQHDKAHAWRPVTGTGLNSLLAGSNPPLYRTVLAQAEAYGESKPSLYSGPFFIDIDVCVNMGGIETAISQLNVLLGKLAALGVGLDQVRIFATGGRGFHLEIPSEIFAPNLNPSPDLPAIYRRMAEAVYVDGVDLNVYSARKGRMWRVPNRQRESGAFKVPVSLDQVRKMTFADYARLTSCPQPWPRLKPTCYAPALAVEFSKAKDAVMARARARARPKASKESAALKRRFGGSLPPSLLLLLQARVQSPAGFNRIAMQIAATARACGVDIEALLRQAQPLLEKHRGDGSRYRTASARAEELRHQYECTEYAFSVGGLRSILPRGMGKELGGL
jgi:hypothetical protein